MDSKAKNINNHRFAIGLYGNNIMVLDGEKCRTTKAIQKYSRKRKRIKISLDGKECVNKQPKRRITIVEHNVDTHKEQKLQKEFHHWNNVDLKHGKIKDHIDKTTDTLYLDLLGYKLDGIIPCIEKMHQTKQAKLFLTIAARFNNNPFTEFKNQRKGRKTKNGRKTGMNLTKYEEGLLGLLRDHFNSAQIGYVYPYRRDGKSQLMAYMEIYINWPTEIYTEYRIKSVEYHPIKPDKYLVKYYGYPKLYEESVNSIPHKKIYEQQHKKIYERPHNKNVLIPDASGFDDYSDIEDDEWCPLMCFANATPLPTFQSV